MVTARSKVYHFAILMAVLLAGYGLTLLLLHETSCDSDNQVCLICQSTHSLAPVGVPLIAVVIYASVVYRLPVCCIYFEQNPLWAACGIRAPPQR